MRTHVLYGPTLGYTYDISICTIPQFLAEAEMPLSQLSERPWGFSISAAHMRAGRKPSLAEIYRLAGLFEGEGSFTEAEIKIPQKEPEVLFQVVDLFGGRVLGPHRTTSPYTGKTYWRYVWAARNQRARSIAYTIYHLLTHGSACGRDLCSVFHVTTKS